ncbi:helix-turn-helix transcriptional regulator [Demequina oxidasica]|uniref:helix-turn-helix transcriptional regulator n=1 Tax=Demequina oxidasica TaxID=676199 RepID=UPI0007864F5D|nr:WYL domain-containing protein [Demequina oxidasica]
MAQADAAERLLNLIIALTNAPRRMTRDEIRNTVAGYSPRPHGANAAEAKSSDDAFERMFERDKKALRELGVPLSTVTDPLDGADIGYKIVAADAAMPTLDLTASEVAVLSLAAEYWQGATLGDDARLGLTKLASHTPHQVTEPMPWSALSTSSRDATSAFVDAIHERQCVRFDYTSVTSGSAIRNVQPWRLLVRGGTEYLVGLDIDKGETRTYRVSRVHGQIKLVGEPGSFERPEVVPDSIFSDAVGGDAIIALRPESGYALRARATALDTSAAREIAVESASIGVTATELANEHAPGQWELFKVHYEHLDLLRDEILSLRGAAKVIMPEALAASVVDYARKALEVARG